MGRSSSSRSQSVSQTRSDAQTLRIGTRELTFRRLSKPLYPSGFTKADVIDYYLRVAPVILPHLADRPVSLKRLPDGVGGVVFWEKDAPRYTPAWVQTTDVWRRSGESQIHYVVIGDVATLAWAASIAAIELHPFLHRAGRLGRPRHAGETSKGRQKEALRRADDLRPTAVVFDLDPGEGADIFACVEVAFLLRDALTARGLMSVVKVSGSKGLQLYVPLNSGASYDETQPFARSLAEDLAAAHPRSIVADMTKALRARKVFIDWSQNADFKTTVGVYSLRAKADRPFVSLPVTWDELKKAARTGDRERLFWDPDAALTRIESVGDLFAPVLTMQQALPHPGVRTSRAVPVRRRSMPASASGTSASATGWRRSRQGSGMVPTTRVPRLSFIKPMLAEQRSTVPRGPEWIYEAKLDGYRVEAIKEGQSVRLLSRNANDLGRDYPDVVAAVAALPVQTAILDGEIVALDDRGRPSFQSLQHRRKVSTPVVYFAFDLLHVDGEDLRSLPLQRRKDRLAAVVAGSRVPLSEALPGDVDHIAAAIQDLGLEGIVAKRARSRYVSARSDAWIKVKFLVRQEFVVGAYKPGLGNFESLIVGYYDAAGRLEFAGKVRNGFTPHLRAELFRELKALETDVFPFAAPGTRKRSHWGEGLTAEDMRILQWLTPKLVVEVAFVEWTRDGHLRHPTFVGIRRDKRAREVTRERDDPSDRAGV
jgi:bifunctional non-homologous end joining protein LigD